MGMAASQARFLGLTARKSNVEYQVQQINQQRTSLANESAGLYNQMLELSVPTPPSPNDYKSIKYVLDDSGDGYTNGDYSIVNMTKTYENQGEYLVSLSTTVDEARTKTNTFYPNGAVSTSVDTEGVKSYVIPLINKDTSNSLSLTYVENASAYNDKKELSITPYQIYKINEGDNTNLIDGYSTCKNTTDGADIEYFYQDSAGKNHFLSQSDMDALLNGAADGYSFMTTYTYSKEVLTQVKAYVEQSSNDRLTSITIEDDENYPESLRGLTFSLSAVQVTDEDAYDQATKDYEYQYALYEKTMSDINSQTESIQAKDQALELQIKQLDTEQNAIATEMDSVQKIIEDNVEATFKIFA